MKKNSEKNSSLDSAFQSFSQKIADGTTRRDLLYRFGAVITGIVGAGLIPSFLGGKVYAGNPCLVKKDDCGKFGDKCGLNSPRDCSYFKKCPGCVQADGCPKNTVATGYWASCCLCFPQQDLDPSKGIQGRLFWYQDCSFDSTTPSGDPGQVDAALCGKCLDKGLETSGCKTTARCFNGGWVPAGHEPICTMVVDKNQTCYVKDGKDESQQVNPPSNTAPKK